MKLTVNWMNLRMTKYPFGNLAVRSFVWYGSGPVALRPRLATGLPFRGNIDTGF